MRPADPFNSVPRSGCQYQCAENFASCPRMCECMLHSRVQFLRAEIACAGHNDGYCLRAFEEELRRLEALIK